MTTTASKRTATAKRIALLFTSTTTTDGRPEDVRAAEDLTQNARAIQKALRSVGHTARCIPFGYDIAALGERLRAFGADVIFNLAEAPLGSYAKEPHAAAVLEILGIPYTGNGPLALALCKNKALTKQLLLANGVPTPRACVIEDMPKKAPPLSFPMVVKPLCEDGSFGITDESVVENLTELRRSVAYVLRDQRQAALVEEFVGGREFNVSVLGNGSRETPYRAMPPGEFVYHSPRWRVCTFDAKWNEHHPSYAAVEAVYPARINVRLARQLECISIQCARIFELAGYARLDFRLDAKGRPHLLDVNPNPDLAPGMGFARAAASGGIQYPALLLDILRCGAEKGAR